MRQRLILAIKIGVTIDLLLLITFAVIVCAASTHPKKPQPIRNTYYPFTVEASVRDRPLLETVEQVTQARRTGVSEFDFDGEHYVVVGLPKHYIDYASWCVRMP